MESNNTYLYSGVITICYLIISVLEMRFINDEAKPLKDLFKNGLLVFFSSLCGMYVLSHMNSTDIKPLQKAAEIFSGNPEF